MVFRSPKYYEALRKYRREKELQASSSKQQAPSNTKPEPSSGSQISSNKHQAPSDKRQA